MHKITIEQHDGMQKITTQGKASTRVQVCRMPKPRQKPSGERLEQLREQCRKMNETNAQRRYGAGNGQ